MRYVITLFLLLIAWQQVKAQQISTGFSLVVEVKDLDTDAPSTGDQVMVYRSDSVKIVGFTHEGIFSVDDSYPGFLANEMDFTIYVIPRTKKWYSPKEKLKHRLTAKITTRGQEIGTMFYKVFRIRYIFGCTRFSLPVISFKNNGYEPVNKSMPALDSITKLLTQNTNWVIKLRYYDSISSPNEAWTKQRLNYVYNYLVKNGIEKERLLLDIKFDDTNPAWLYTCRFVIVAFDYKYTSYEERESDEY
ncbi:MAG TPA: hypothetical protein VK177_08920 [Flavobacteriales bacterium]|nr:hypothetical protein [Flavobacteriales bacterium]